MKWWVMSLAAGVVLLLLADVLAFHDLEPHTVRDWLMLAGSVLAVVALIGGSAGQLRAASRRA
jgi:hypothetical protein